MKLRLLYVFLFVFFFKQISVAQISNSLYFIDLLPQRTYINPALADPYGSTLSVPFLSGMQLELDNNFLSWRNAFGPNTENGIKVQQEYFLSKIGRVGRLSGSMNDDIFRYSWSKGDNFFQVGMGVHADAQIRMGKDSWAFFLQGYGLHEGETRLEHNSVDINSYVSMYFGYARQINRNLRIGGRVKLLNGLLNFHTKRMSAVYHLKNADMSDPDVVPYSGEMSMDLLVQSNFPLDQYMGVDLPAASQMIFRNLGGSLDFGVSYDLGKKWTFAASVSDLGFLVWNDTNTGAYESGLQNVEYEYDGVNPGFMSNYRGPFWTVLDFWHHVEDSVRLQKVGSDSYTTMIPTTFTASATYRFTPQHHLSMLFKGLLYNGYFAPELAVGYTFRLNEKFAVSASNTFSSASLMNLGLALVGNAGPVQLYLSVDRVNAFSLANMRSFSLNFGVNVILEGKDASGRYGNGSSYKYKVYSRFNEYLK